MKKLLIIALSLACFSCCERTFNTQGGGVHISDGNGEATLYIIEKDGYKFGVLVGAGKCALVQIH